MLVGGAAGYHKRAQEYYEVELSVDDVAAVFGSQAITPELAARLNPDVDYEALQVELRKIGYT